VRDCAVISDVAVFTAGGTLDQEVLSCPSKLDWLQAEVTVRETLYLKCVGSIGNQLEDVAAVWLTRIRDEKFAFSERRAGGSEGDVTSNGICGFPFERGSSYRFENGERDPLEVGAASTSLKNRAGRGQGEEGDRGSD